MIVPPKSIVNVSKNHHTAQLNKNPSSSIELMASTNKTQKSPTIRNDQEEAKQEETKKEIVYQVTGVKIGTGKLGQVELIVYKNDLHALKKIPKIAIDKPKRIQHLKSEKTILNKLKKLDTDMQNGVSHFYVSDLFRMSDDHDTKDSSLRNSYFIDDIDNASRPLNYIVRLIETFQDRENVNFIFEYLPGENLYQLIQQEMNFMPFKQKKKRWVSFYSSQVLCALETLQRYSIIYRDLKPENVMIDREGLIKLIDFGFAKFLTQSTKFKTTTNCGTLGYTAPEVLMGQQGYSFQADIWSFGILLCELIQG